MLSCIKFSKKMLIELKEAKQKHDFRKMCSLVLNFWPPLYIRDGEPLTRRSLSDPLVVSKTVGKNGNEHLRNEEKFICLCCGIEDLSFAVHTQ